MLLPTSSPTPATTDSAPAARRLPPQPGWHSDPAIRSNVRRAAARFVALIGDPALEAADVEQDLCWILDRAMRRHDPRVSGPATYANAVIARSVLQMIRGANADRRRANLRTETDADLSANRGASDPEGLALFRRVLSRALESLSPADRELLRLKASGIPTGVVATRVGIHRDTVHARMVAIRAHLEGRGLLEKVA